MATKTKVKKIELLPVQMKLLQSTKDISGIYSSRAAGKTYCASILCAMALNKNERVLVLAQNYKALKDNVFTEIQKRLNEFGIKYKCNHSDMTISSLSGEGKIFCGSYENLDAMRGYTEINLAILDEVAFSPPNLFGVIAPCLRGKGIVPKIRFFSSPKIASWFNIYLKQNNIEYFTSTIYQNTFLTDESRKLMEKSVSNETLRKQELYGEILDGVGDNVILSQKDFSNSANFNLPTNDIVIGVDCSGFGKDSNAVVIRNDRRVLEVHKVQVATSSELEALIEQKIHQYGEPRFIAIDMAYGSALYEKLSVKYMTHLVPFSAKSEDEQYYNKRCQMYFYLANAVKQGFYVDNEDIRLELVNTTFILKGDKLILESKDVIKGVLGHSPDASDALALTFYDGYEATSYKNTEQAEQYDDSTWNAFAMNPSW